MEKTRVYVGLDPGVSGGIAWIKGDQSGARAMPKTFKEMYIQFEIYKPAPDEDVLVYLEHVHSSPRMGVSGAFTFGENFGMMQVFGVMIGKLHLVRPLEWQRALNCQTGGDKKISLKKAKELFPDKNITLATADALLLAYYGWLKNG